jgi:hypothetical protein
MIRVVRERRKKKWPAERLRRASLPSPKMDRIGGANCTCQGIALRTLGGLATPTTVARYTFGADRLRVQSIMWFTKYRAKTPGDVSTLENNLYCLVT